MQVIMRNRLSNAARMLMYTLGDKSLEHTIPHGMVLSKASQRGMTMNTYLFLATGTSALVCLLHVFGGGPQVVGPLLKSEMAEVPKYLNYYCWHLVTLTLVVMTAGFLLAALNPNEVMLALLMTLLAASFAIWSLGLVLWKRQSPWDMPQWILFLPIAVFGSLGLWL